ncbi:tRNA (guanine(26)-N(2))-dimethyltransferase [Natrialba magadii ATCC 43099]|uniref:tRNA (guanine(26)-N(2))-dimethyltransferase n=1 Tax=Natrialba magadii (strain ATCC 43099 / DSM 3394 / CCM 3739 / CIP 104546 / IAM 13178 / JCM 8861 / NBRC 102185 / NCIMB 2190 / MS3) TaxID=547559 RepID=D3STL7_NATMM|nr:tRNA (guanine(26)-N(2))-dimethyltransferase [Natrialba magadii]ADD05034.1 tRNA (guanine(26)-N(2))-dimethyltransferase [Natrialba magadii ATCC 43099]ELY23408.1 N(2),N(2)-dimethylguanosine tRNA methyltransferase [Natrialba magadii ATCC 43099]
MRVTEGGVELEVPGEQTDGVEESVFYNPRQELNRDLTIATLRAYRDREERAESYLDAMTASGIRGVRAAADGWEVTCSDVNEDAVELARSNLARNDCEGTVEHRNGNALMHEQVFDVIDLDPYGTPMPFADAAFANCRDLVCVTATDTAPLCGAHFNSGVRSYAAVPRNTDYHAEMGVRILLSALARSAARFDVGVEPILTHATSHYVRTYLELEHKATSADAAVDELGYIHHCEDCLYREHENGLIADPVETCPHCDGNRMLTAGPVWLGSIRDPEFVAAVREEVSAPDEFGTAEKARELCIELESELDEPTHYDQHKLCRNWGLPANAMDDFLADLREAGYEASRAHYGGTTFKTDASVDEIRTATADNLV